MARQGRPAQVVETCGAGRAAVALPMRLDIVAAVAHHGGTAATGAVDAVRPAMLPDQREALGLVEQGREVQQARGRHGHHQTIEGNHLNRLLLLTLRSAHSGTTLESDKSHARYPEYGAARRVPN